MAFKVLFSPASAREYKKLDPSLRLRIQSAIDSLGRNPLNGPGIKRLKGRLKDYYRSRAGDYRILYAVDAKNKVVWVDYIQRRRDVYRGK